MSDVFQVDVGGLKSRPKEEASRGEAVADRAGEEMGFVSREPKARRGRRASPRTGQVHAKVLPHVSKAIAAEALQRGVTQGVVIEEAWADYLAARGRGKS